MNHCQRAQNSDGKYLKQRSAINVNRSAVGKTVIGWIILLLLLLKIKRRVNFPIHSVSFCSVAQSVTACVLTNEHSNDLYLMHAIPCVFYEHFFFYSNEMRIGHLNRVQSKYEISILSSFIHMNSDDC